MAALPRSRADSLVWEAIYTPDFIVFSVRVRPVGPNDSETALKFLPITGGRMRGFVAQVPVEDLPRESSLLVRQHEQIEAARLAQGPPRD